jgi:hypothetical protein
MLQMRLHHITQYDSMWNPLHGRVLQQGKALHVISYCGKNMKSSKTALVKYNHSPLHSFQSIQHLLQVYFNKQ